MVPTSIVRTRLRPPRLPPDCQPRPRLVGRILEGLQEGVVAVLAGAGFGKSTALAMAAHASTTPVAWCSCDQDMESATLFLDHLSAALGELVPGFGADLSLAGTVQDQVYRLINEVTATVLEDVVMMIDDVHALPDCTSATLGPLVAGLPLNVHVALSGRASLPFRLGQLRGRRAMILREPELSFSEDEARGLLQASSLPLSAAEIGEIHRATEGWVTGIILSAQARRGLESVGRPGAESFDYLAEEVVLLMPPELQRFLLLTSVVGRFTPALAEALSGEPTSADIIGWLITNHMFCIRLETGPGGAPWYRYHHLMQAFLRSRLAEREPEALTETHRCAAAWLIRAGEPIEAIPHLLAARDFEEAVRTLEPLAGSLIRGPLAPRLRSWLEAIPERLWRQVPSLVLARAGLLSIDGQYEEAFEAVDGAVTVLVEEGDHEQAALALGRLVKARVTAGLGSPAGMEWAARALNRIDPESRLAPLVKILLAGGKGWACRFEEAEQDIADALSSPVSARSPLPRIYATIIREHLIERIRGRAGEVPAALDAAIVELLQLGDRDELDLAAYASSYRAFALSYLGRHDEALAEIRRQREIGDRTGQSAMADHAAAWIRFTAAAEAGRWDELAEVLAQVQHGQGPIDRSAMGYYEHAFRAQLFANTQDQDGARAEIRATRTLMTEITGGADFTVLSDLASAAQAAGLGSEARELADQAHGIAVESGAGWGRARAALLRAAINDDPKTTRDALVESLEITSQLGLDDLWVFKERGRAAGLLVEAAAAGLGRPGLVERLVERCGGEVLERLKRDGRSAVRDAVRRTEVNLGAGIRSPLRLVALGGFAVWRAGEPLPPGAFGRERARVLLAAIAASGGAVPRDQILEWLWPDLPPDRAGRALHTTLHALRRALEPGRRRSASESIVRLKGERCLLVLAEDDSFDVAEFLSLASPRSAGESLQARIVRLERAEGLYAGPVFPDWPYAEWATEPRSRLEDAQHLVLEHLAETLIAVGRPEAAIPRLKRLVTERPEKESWHRTLMRAYAATREPALAMRQYHFCRAILRRELGIETGVETRALYQKILAATDSAPGPF